VCILCIFCRVILQLYQAVSNLTELLSLGPLPQQPISVYFLSIALGSSGRYRKKVGAKMQIDRELVKVR
jgi:hypothetical protein